VKLHPSGRPRFGGKRTDLRCNDTSGSSLATLESLELLCAMSDDVSFGGGGGVASEDGFGLFGSPTGDDDEVIEYVADDYALSRQNQTSLTERKPLYPESLLKTRR
jgi:hypothetical protein